METTKQLRGNCQCCGRQQAVKNGVMAKHGYTVEHGWFNGVCSGERYAPIQVSRTHTDKIIADIRAEIPELLKQAEQVIMGWLLPEFVEVGNFRNRTTIAYEDADQYDQRQAREKLEWSLKMKAKAGESFIQILETVANEYHGKPLVQVTKQAPVQIEIGEKRFANNATYVATQLDGARVYFKAQKDEKIWKSWIGSTAWRKMEKV
jgi:hypothetical protein